MRLAGSLAELRKLGPSDICLFGEKPDVLRPGIVGTRGSMVIRLTPMHDVMSALPHMVVTPAGETIPFDTHTRLQRVTIFPAGVVHRYLVYTPVRDTA